MPTYSSPREKRLWLWTLAVVLAIYATLGPARAIADALREQNLLRVAFGLLVAGVLAVAVKSWIRERPRWRDVGIALGVLLVYGFAFLRMDNPAERTHLIEYGVVAALIHQALLERARNGRSVPQPAAIAVALAACLGLIDEGIQAILPNRVFDWWDVLFNFLAAFMAVVARLALAADREPGWRLWFLWSLVGFVAWGWAMDPGSFGLSIRTEILGFDVGIPLLASVATGAIITGAGQWLLLRKYLPKAWQWLGGSATAAALTLLLGTVLPAADAHVLNVALFGATIGTAHWLVLRPHLQSTIWWIPVSSLAWLVTIPYGDIAGPPGWAIYTAITGAALVWMIRKDMAQGAT